MADIVISGDSSGSVTLRAPAVSGTTILTLPTTSGTLVTTAGGSTVPFALGSAAAPSITFTGDTNTGMFSPGADIIAFSEGGVESMRIDASGNVGIGTSTVTTAFNKSLQVYQPTTGNAGLRVNAGSTTGFDFIQDQTGASFIYNRDNSYTAFGTNNAERMRIDSAGNVGIGTNSPNFRLQLNTPTASAAQYLQITNGSTGSAASDGMLVGVDTSNEAIVWMQESAALKFATSNAERMRIDSSGNLLVGTTTALGRVVINGVSGSEAAGLYVTNFGDGIGYGAMFRVSPSAGGGNGRIFFMNASNSNVGQITISTGGTAYVTTSDYRLKESIAPMTGALDKVSLLKPCTYKWKADGSSGQGFIAHELAEVVPDAVVGNKDEVNEDGSVNPQGIDTSFLVATLTAAIQELNAKVTALEAQLGAK